MNILSMIGESITRAVADVARSNDGSYIGVQTAKGSYSGGEMLSGFVVLQNNSVRQVDRVLLKITVKERTYWDEEVARQMSEGEGENRKTWTVWEHYARSSKVTHCKDIVVASQLPHMLAPGAYSYPFAYPLRADLPGTARFRKLSEPSDPAWRGRQLECRGEVVCKVKAYLDVSGLFSRDLRCVQEITVNPAFNWQAMQPARGEKAGQVLLLCCIPRGRVTLSAAFDRAAYMAGETAGIRANIKNESEQDVQCMHVKLVRTISLRDSVGHSKRLYDVMCKATFPGVAKQSEAPRDMPLALVSGHGPLLPGTRGRLVEISYVRAPAPPPPAPCPPIRLTPPPPHPPHHPLTTPTTPRRPLRWSATSPARPTLRCTCP